MNGQGIKDLVRSVSTRTRVGLILSVHLACRAYGGTDKAAHGYAKIYDKLFRRLRLRRVGIIEIGVGGDESPEPGGSLRLWRDIFPRARIVGVDILEKDVRLGRRVRFVRGDQTSVEDLGRAIDALGGRGLDVVIDDGSHLLEHADVSFRFLFPYVRSGGLYIVEDVHTSFWPEWGGAARPSDRTALGMARAIVEDVQHGDRAFVLFPARGEPPHVEYSPEIAALYVFPGMFVVVKR